jgi:hypothetical protein
MCFPPLSNPLRAAGAHDSHQNKTQGVCQYHQLGGFINKKPQKTRQGAG